MSGRRILRDGLALGAVFGTVALLSILINPIAWIEDYPPDVQAAVEGTVAAPVLFQAVVGLMLLAVLVGGIALSIRGLDREVTDLRFGGVAAHVFLLSLMVNAFDVVVVDWLFFMHLLRRWTVLPGTEGLAGYDDYYFHFAVSFLQPGPWIGSIVVSVTAGAIWWFAVARRRRSDGGARA